MSKLTFIILCLCLSTTWGYGQSISGRKTDKFDGTTTVYTTDETLSRLVGIPLIKLRGVFIKTNDAPTPFASLYFSFLSDNIGSLIPNESYVTILFDNGQTMEFTYHGQFEMFPEKEWVYFYSMVTKEQLKEMEGRMVTDIRIVSIEGKQDYKIKEKNWNTVGKIATLLLNEYTPVIAKNP